jgi:hypothetical protein
MSRYEILVNDEVVNTIVSDEAYATDLATSLGGVAVSTDPVIDPAIDPRSKRDELLQESDWTQLADSVVNSTLWAIYRQDLRDVPQQSEFPDNVAWPEKP